jgi:magnesium-protoporphyrin O-methyltransferase
MPNLSSYAATRSRVEDYFDRSATRVWAQLTSDAKVSRIRQTVREGRDRMRATMLERLPFDLYGMRILDAGCGTGLMSAELAARGADVVAIDLSPKLIDIARSRLPAELARQVTFLSGDMTDVALGRFDHVMAMDSMIYYRQPDLLNVLQTIGQRAPAITFTVAPRTRLLMAMWTLGKLFPKSDRSPAMVPHDHRALTQALPGLSKIGRVSRGFYISECLEYRACS